ncbi:MAG: hypothetical protein QM758_16990 [Armatimonas sp.]
MSELELWFADAGVKQAVARMRQGLGKNVRSPRATLSIQSEIPEFALMRRLGRLLRHQIQLNYAMGRHSEAARSVEDGMRLGYVVCYDCLLAGLVGGAILSLTLAGAMRYQTAWSALDCERYLRLSREWLASPDPFAPLMSGERSFFDEALAQFEKEPQKFITELMPTSEDEDEDQRLRRERLEAIADDATMRARLARGAQAAFDQWVRDIPVFLNDPARPLPQRQSSDQTLAALIDTVIVSPNATNRFASTRVVVQLFGVHAALQRYWWEKGSYPENLAALKLADFIIDPYTRQSFSYKVQGQSYELASAGPADPNQSGKRTPVTLPARKI